MPKKNFAANEFTLRCRDTTDFKKILEHAIELFQGAYQFSGGEAVYICPLDSTKYSVIKNRNGSIALSSTNFKLDQSDLPDWGQFTQPTYLTTLGDFATLSHLSRQMRKFAEDPKSANQLVETLPKTPSIIMPLFTKDKFPLGYIHVYQDKPLDKVPDVLSNESERQFLTLAKCLVDISLEKTMCLAQLDLSDVKLSTLNTTAIGLRHKIESLEKNQSKIQSDSHKAGMSDVATGVLHNIGNVLNSINVSTTLIATLVEKLKTESLQKAVGLLIQNQGQLDTFLATDEFGKPLLSFFEITANDFSVKRNALQKECAALSNHLEHVKSVINIQQSYAKAGGLLRQCSILELVEDSIGLGMPRHQDNNIELETDFVAIPMAWMERHKVMQIMVNLISNARNSLAACGKKRKILKISFFRPERDRVRIAVKDNGIGIPLQNLNNIFAQGFSTRKDGHGFGLHTSANAVKELGGKLWCESPGTDQGATFFLELPLVVDVDVDDNLKAMESL